ncbi:DUF5994 family protein [Streptomyces flavofungini]|uniref:DUF5994 family protein n=1 Tax=Streptomyces flavofungini TaxID=68200 RepID=UPI0025B1A735|nr:DUF5994 family protein [Streptomyces flavofungini]WJV47204.1 DUF5994 family protein [Streptomyces flavofungini]
MAAPVRLALGPTAFPPGPLSGAWWPRSDDLKAELPALAAVFDPHPGRITRIATTRDAWSTTSHDLPVQGHTVRARWVIPGCDPYTIRLFSYAVARWDLLVIPHGTAADTAGRLMSAASDPANRLTAGALVAAEQERLPVGGPQERPTVPAGYGRAWRSTRPHIDAYCRHSGPVT